MSKKCHYFVYDNMNSFRDIISSGNCPSVTGCSFRMFRCTKASVRLSSLIPSYSIFLLQAHKDLSSSFTLDIFKIIVFKRMHCQMYKQHNFQSFQIYINQSYVLKYPNQKFLINLIINTLTEDALSERLLEREKFLKFKEQTFTIDLFW